MGNIVLLDDLTINQIAAGEVIERPASVIKEMVENSIDAGANNITVEIKNGGISYIKVTDNGKGISADDIEIAFERHATSKIRSANDLNLVTSMGFRGEALASIAAIANVELTSKTANQETGYTIVVEGGNILIDKQEVGCQTGTSIVVKNLFFNTPVRYKFLKKDYTESGYIEDVITRIALVNPDVAIKLINSGKTVIQTTGNGDIKTVIYSIYGKDVATGILPVDYTYEDIQITGVIGKPEIARSNRSNQLFFVNKRYIKDKTLSAATEQAFKGLIPIGRYGFVILNIEMNPSKVDVNVHPAKLEVRFEEENKIFQAIYHSIKDVLLKSELVANTEKKENGEQEEVKKEESEGLFDFRKNETKKIEQYNDEESKIKTNVNVGQGGPINTADILEQLKKMREDLERQVEENSNIKLNSNYTDVIDKKVEKNEEIVKDETVIDDANQSEEKIELEEFKSIHNSLSKEEVIDMGYNDLQELEENKNSEDVNILNVVEDEKDLSLDNVEIQKTQGESEELEKQENKENLESLENSEISNQIEEKENTEENEEIESQEIEDEKIEKVEDTETAEYKLKEVQEQINKLESMEYDVTSAEDFDEMYAKLFGKKPISIDEIKKENEDEKNTATDILKDNISVFEEEAEYQKPTYKFIGIVFNTYIIIEIDKEMYILDQHAAHERIMYEKVKKNYYSDTAKDSQMLLLPDIITLSHKEMDIAKENMDMFKKAGFSLEEFGENTIKLTGVPTVCIDIDNKYLFLETLDEINTVARTAKQEKEEKFIATIACKAAVKANMVLAQEEVESLMDKLFELPNPFTCPHGRPTAIKMTKYDIERKFARK